MRVLSRLQQRGLRNESLLIAQGFDGLLEPGRGGRIMNGRNASARCMRFLALRTDSGSTSGMDWESAQHRIRRSCRTSLPRFGRRWCHVAGAQCRLPSASELPSGVDDVRAPIIHSQSQNRLMNMFGRDTRTGVIYRAGPATRVSASCTVSASYFNAAPEGAVAAGGYADCALAYGSALPANAPLPDAAPRA